MTPCIFDHNGECLVCDCWPSDCAYKRMLNEDYKWETKEQLEKMFQFMKDKKCGKCGSKIDSPKCETCGHIQ